MTRQPSLAVAEVDVAGRTRVAVRMVPAHLTPEGPAGPAVDSAAATTVSGDRHDWPGDVANERRKASRLRDERGLLRTAGHVPES